MRREPDVPPERREGIPGPGQTDAERTADEEHLHELQRARQARVAKVLVALAIVVILVIFIISNSQPVEVDFVFVTRHPRLIWVMFGCAVLGGLVGYLIGRPGKQVRLHRKQEDQRKK
ncbi:MAG TPA: LapA family protein [Actinomycetota bacterium]|jgi:uncharacterized integral membrane protein